MGAFHYFGEKGKDKTKVSLMLEIERRLGTTHQNAYSFANKIAEKGLDATLELTQVMVNNANWKMYLCWQVIRF